MNDLEKLKLAAAGFGRVVVLPPTLCCDVIWTSGEARGDAMGWTRTGECGKCGKRLVTGIERLEPTMCGQPMNLNADGSTHADLICCNQAFGHGGAHART